MFFRKKKDEEKVAPEEELKQKLKPKKVEKEDDGLVWDKKRIAMGLILALIIVLAAGEVKKTFFPNVDILGESTVKKVSQVQKPEIGTPNVDLQSQVTSSLDDIKNNINDIDPEQVATSSPQIQKVLRDIQGIKNLPADKARNTCMKICSGI